MKPTIKIPYKEFMQNALMNFCKETDIHLVTETAEYKLKHPDGDLQVFDIPDYIEVEVDLPGQYSGSKMIRL